jgi:hypothetical protein
VLFLNYEAKFSTSSIFKKINKDNFKKKLKQKKLKKKKEEEVNFGGKKSKKNVRQKKKGKISKKKKTNTWGKLTFIKHITMTVYRTNLHFSTSVTDII